VNLRAQAPTMGILTVPTPLPPWQRPVFYLGQQVRPVSVQLDPQVGGQYPPHPGQLVHTMQELA
jgi:hypothetical protein